MFKHTSPLKFYCVQTPTTSISSLCQLIRSVQLVILLFLGLAAGKNVYAENSAPLQAQDLPYAEITPIANGSYETPWQIISLALDANEHPRQVWLQNGSDQAYFVYAETNELNTSFTFEDGFSATPPAAFNYYFSSSDEKYFYFFRDKRLQLSGGEISFSFDNIQVDETTHEPSFDNLSINLSGNGTPICGAPTNGTTPYRTTPYSTTNAATLSWVGASEAATSAQNIETSCIETGIVAADIFLDIEYLSNLMLALPQSLLVGTPLISSEWAVTEGFITEQGGQAYAFSNGNNKAYLVQSSAEEYLTFADGYNLISLPDLTKVEFILTSPQTLEFDRWGG